MKSIILILVVNLTSSFCYADIWQDHWVRAVEYCGSKNYEVAEMEFNLSIAILEANKDDSHPHVYVDRARLYLLLDRFNEALADLNKAIASKYLTETDRIRGLVTRIFTGSNLKMDEQVLTDYDAFKAISPNFPKVEFTKEQVIVRNMPKSSCYRKLAKAFLVSSEICESESDIIELDSGIMIAKKKMVDCGCGCGGGVGKMAIMPIQANIHQQNIDSCKFWCDKNELIALAWCAKVFKRWDCQTGCLFAVDLIKDGCHWCCDNGSFYQKMHKAFWRYRISHGATM